MAASLAPGLLALGLLASPAAARSEKALNAGWRFWRGEVPGADATAFDDSGWQQVALPHSYNAADGADGGGDYYRGAVWYRRHLRLHALNGKRAFLEFGAATLRARVYVNGRLAGRHAGGFAAFRLDVTGLLRPGDNLIAVQVDNRQGPDLAPTGGDFTVFGGLTRPARLILTDAVHLDLTDDGGPGLYVTTEHIEPAAADLRILARIANDGDTPAKTTLNVQVRDAGGHAVASVSLPATLGAGQILTLRHRLKLPRPHLWDGVRDPYLYRVTASVAGDRVSVPLGVRSFRVDPDKGFILNGRAYDLHGVNYFHAQRPGRGTAVGDAEIDEDFRLMRELGVSAIRMAHFQHPQRAYDDADRAGFVTWSEIPLNTTFDGSPEFLASVRRQMREMIVQNFNHPSVAIWGLGNELRISDAASNRLLAAAQKTAKTLDPGRPTAYAHCCLADDDPLTRHADLNAYNRYWGLYAGPDTLWDIGPWADKLHAAMPARPIAISEYGGCAAISEQEDPPSRPKGGSRWHPEQYQTKFHQAYWNQLKRRPYLWANFVWQMFDTASDGRSDGATPGINDKGLVTFDRATKKDAYFWYKANWSQTPLVYIASRRFTPRRRGTADIRIFTNQPSVTLTLNGRRIGSRPAKDRAVLWRDVPLTRGDNIVDVKAPDGAADRVVWRFEP